MSSKTITVDFEAWKIMNDIKKPGQSASGVIKQYLGPIANKIRKD